MATTDFSTLSAANKVVQTTLVMKAGRDSSLVMSSGMIGKADDANRPIQLITELNATDRGASAVIHLIQDLLGDGIAALWRRLNARESKVAWRNLELALPHPAPDQRAAERATLTRKLDKGALR